MATGLTAWGALDGAGVSWDSVGDLGSVRHAFDTAGHRFYQPELRGIAAGQRWTLTARDRVLGASGTATMHVEFYDGSGRYLAEVAGKAVALPRSTLAGGAWTPVAATVTVPVGAASAHVVQTGDFGTASGTAFKATACDYESVTSTPSGVPMPLGDLPPDAQSPRGWQQVFTDDFTMAGKASANGALPDGKWWGYDPGTKITNSTNGVYDSGRTVSVSDGQLRFHLFSAGGTAYAAVESPKIAGTQTYGRYTVRYRYEPGSNVAGFKSVFMTWPDDDHWNEGEIDFQEFGNQANRSSVSAAFHQACTTAPCDTTASDYTMDPTVWHTATEAWSPGSVKSYVDGHLIGASTTAVPTSPMHLLLQTEASDYGPTAAPSTVMNIDVDWVAVYRRS